MNLNLRDGGQRKYVLVQFPEPVGSGSKFRDIAELCRGRIKSASPSATIPFIDKGFRFLRLKSSNFKTWNADYELANESAIAEQLRLHTDHLLPDRSQEDILYEILLKAGYPLTSRIEAIEITGQSGFSVSDGNLIICLEAPIQIETLRAIISLKPRPVQVICLDHAFEGNDQIKTNLKLEMEAHGIEFRTV